VAVTGGRDFQSISVGYETTCGLTIVGAGFCWGYNFGALGDGTSNHRSIPGAIFGGFKFWDISPGTGYSCGVTTANMVFCWGSNANGELGDGTTEERLTPTLVRWPSG
jgi:alpha-tubulin suppressor-like RCC1 family protein